MKSRASFSKLSVLVISILLLVVNGALGTILILQSRNDLRQQMQGRMLDILNSAASLLDGDVLEKLQKEDEDTPEYQYSLGILRAFQDNFKLDYIYGIRDMGNKQFSFTIDPAPVDPGEFGEPIVYTDALYSASLGIAAFDKEPYEDKWGRFYSAYVPVFNSKGKVGGIIAVDADADWYEKRLREHIITVLIICIVSLLAGGIIVFLVISKLHRRLSFINIEMNLLTEEVDELAHALKIASGRRSDSFEYNDSYKLYEEDSQSLKRDEFAAVLDISDDKKLDEIFKAIDSAVAETNERNTEFNSEASLAISKGYAVYTSGKDSDVQSVFRRADEQMYSDKAAYYKKHDRRHR